MISLVVTGGISSGKSKVCEIIEELLDNVSTFSTDDCVHELYQNEAIIDKVSSICSEAIIDGAINRSILREHFLASEKVQKAINKLVHPVVQRVQQSSMAQAENSGAELFITEVPSLISLNVTFETDFTLLVTADEEVRFARCQSKRNFSQEVFENVCKLQTSAETAARKADLVLLNSGSEEVLKKQITIFLKAVGFLSSGDVEDDLAEEDGEVIIPDVFEVNELRSLSLPELEKLATTLPLKKHIYGRNYLVVGISSFYGKEGSQLVGSGVIVQRGKDAHAMVCNPLKSFASNIDDFYVPASLVKEHGLRCGHFVNVKLRPPRDRDKYITVTEIVSIEGQPAEEVDTSANIENLTPIFPDERFIIELEGEREKGVRVVDLVAPLGKGSRGLIVAPPRAGKTVLLKQVAKAISINHPDTELIILLLDERPEEVTDFEETVDAQVYASTFDEPAKRHAEVAEIVLERAKRLTEQGKDVVLLLDSLTRLARGHNNAQKGGPVGSGGLNPIALQISRKFFGSARNIEEGGSLTILATALVETESRMDDAIFEEFKGTGNLEVRLSRELAEMRIFPAIHIPQSGTRNDDRLYHPEELNHVLQMRRQLSQMPAGEALEVLLKDISKTSNNAELLLRGLS